MPLPKWAGSLTLETHAVYTFGRNRRLLGLSFSLSEDLRRMRTEAEAILCAAGLPWSKQWAFSPHLVIGPLRAKTPAPATVRFDRMEWR